MKYIIIIFIIFIAIYLGSTQGFYVEPNMITDGFFLQGSSPLQLEGPGNTAWSGY